MNWRYHPRIRLIANLLRQGAVIAYPTEAVWGLGCDPENAHAVQRILDLKQRPLHKGLLLVAASAYQLEPYVGELSPQDWQRLSAPSDHPVTWVVPASHRAPLNITGGRTTIAVRVSRHPLVAGLCTAFGGPLVSTSANPGGMPPARNGLKVRQYFGGQLDAITPGCVGRALSPSEIRDIHSGEILRPGDDGK